MPAGFDPSIVQDFLTESGELLEQLEVDLVTLEQAPGDLEMINKIFRALHTIKGSASFLALTNLVSIAHAAESALNSARNNVIQVDRAMMDLLLQAVDLLKVQFGQLRDNQDLAVPPEALVRDLTLLGQGRKLAGSSGTPASAPPSSPTAPSAAGKPAPASAPSAPRSALYTDRKLDLGPGKSDLVEFFIADLDESLRRVTENIGKLPDASAAAQIATDADALIKTVEFFGCAQMGKLAASLRTSAEHFGSLAPADRSQLHPRLAGVAVILREQAIAITDNTIREWPVDTLLQRIDSINRGAALTEGLLKDGATSEAALTTDRVRGSASDPDDSPTRKGPSEGADRAAPAAGAPTAPVAPSSTPDHAPANTEQRAPAAAAAPASASAAPDQTIRVEVGRLESLMNLVGELVLQKNRIAALSRKLGASANLDTDSTLREAMTLAASGLDRITSDIQMAVMRTRMQPLDKLFGKYPRLIRDLARKTTKKIDLVIEGGDTEVDKSMIEELGDPLIHLLRNSADHGIEIPADRAAAGKPETGTITLRASHQGNHVQIQIVDDGRGLQRERIAKKAVERGLAKPEQVAAMSDREIFQFIMLPGFSTADVVSDLSGRGVGMDVVRTNIEKIDGNIELTSTPGRGTTITISIPLTVAILPAMMVAVDREIYAVPLGNILEIVRPEPEQITTIGGGRVLRLRDSVLPLFGAADIFGLPDRDQVQAPFVVVLSQHGKNIGLLVTKPLGQQEIVIKPLEGISTSGGPVSGATVRDDGGVSLIVDVTELIRLAESRAAAA